ncbi:MAG: PTS sugar transporter subunit IIC [Elusimicrobia bacterium]|nr:PTS sugar transporter subunit IIC [Elusimicrobiota bacterium]
MTQIFLAAALVGVLSSDTITIGQFMFSRPVVVGPLVGLVFGNPYIGFIVGVCVELIWIRVIPVGVSVPPDSAITAAVSAAAGSYAMGKFGVDVYSAIIVSLSFAIPCGILFKMAEIKIRHRNSLLVDKIKASVAAGRFDRTDFYTAVAVVRIFAVSFVFFIAAFFAATQIPSCCWHIFEILGISSKIAMRFVYILCFAQLFESFIKWK